RRRRRLPSTHGRISRRAVRLESGPRCSHTRDGAGPKSGGGADRGGHAGVVGACDLRPRGRDLLLPLRGCLAGCGPQGGRESGARVRPRHRGARRAERRGSMSVSRLWAVPLALLLAVAPEGQAKSGTPITACGQIVTTRRFLTHDLYCSGSSGIVVGASGVTIDLKGFTLGGDGSFHFGIDDNGGFDGVTVKDGVLRGFHRGVNAESGADGFGVSDVVVTGSV